MTQLSNKELIDNLEPDFVRHNNIQYQLGDVISRYQAIPGLVGFWPFSSVDRDTGGLNDMSGQDRLLTLNGDTKYNYFNDIIPYGNFPGTSDYLARADESGIDITGTETFYNSAIRGLTVGIWARTDTLDANFRSMMGKMTTNQSSYRLQKTDSSTFQFTISTNGTTLVAVTSATIVADQWYFVVGRFNPAAGEMNIDVDSTTVLRSAGVPASIFNGSAPFEIGRSFASANTWSGDLTLAFLSANYLSDAIVSGLFQQSRVLFGV